MTPSNWLTYSERVYRGLLWAYPVGFRGAYRVELVQTFRDCCRAAWAARGGWGLGVLWVEVLWDLCWTAGRERLAELLNTGAMMNDHTAAFDRQLGDVVWVMATLLRSGYSLRQAFETLAAKAPAPASELCQKIMTQLQGGTALPEVLTHLKTQLPSAHMQKVVETLELQLREGGNLADRLEPLGQSIRGAAGSDPALHALVREVAAQTQAPLPPHAEG